jgi:hypothetical protein
MTNRFLVIGDEATIFLHRHEAWLETVIDTADLHIAQSIPTTWCAMEAMDSPTHYAYCKIGRRVVFLHRLLTKCPAHLVVDHQDHDGLNNRRDNIRRVTRSVNGFNRRGLQSNNSSGYRGVTWDAAKRLWSARVKFYGTTINLGRYPTAIEADRAATRYRKQIGCAA